MLLLKYCHVSTHVNDILSDQISNWYFCCLFFKKHILYRIPFHRNEKGMG